MGGSRSPLPLGSEVGDVDCRLSLREGPKGYLMTTPGNQEILIRLSEIERHLGDRIARIEVSIRGDGEMGHRGIAERLQNLELQNAEAPSVHNTIRDEYRSADDALRRETADARGKLHQRQNKLEADWNRAKYLVVGAGLGISLVGGFGGTWLFNLITGGAS